MKHGTLIFHIEDILRQKNISKTAVCKAMDIPRSNFNRYCRNEFQRIDSSLVCKLCSYLDVSVGELIEYLPPEENQ